MISMTGFGTGRFQIGRRGYRVEARSVNNRFLDLRIRLPWTDAELESQAQAMARQRIRRGRVEVTAFEERGGGAGAGLELDDGAARDLRRVLERLTEILRCDLAVAASLIAPVQGLVSAESPMARSEELWPALREGLSAALDGLAAMRAREGASMAEDLARHLAELGSLRARILALTAEEPRLQRERLLERIARLRLNPEGAAPDPVRLAEEVALHADRCDVSEELARLASHYQQLGTMLGGSDAPEAGRRIEFLLQEIHRELNTVASKTVSAEVAHLVVEAKSVVERMREQAQNVE
jgi:uncharacterized protein (TIGR00255 family)